MATTPPHASSWCEFANYLMKDRERTHSDIADKLGKHKGSIQSILAGFSKPPLELLDDWAKFLKLDEHDTEKWMRLAYDAHVPPEVKRRMRKQDEEILALTKRATDLERELELFRQERLEMIRKLSKKGVDVGKLFAPSSELGGNGAVPAAK